MQDRLRQTEAVRTGRAAGGRRSRALAVARGHGRAVVAVVSALLLGLTGPVMALDVDAYLRAASSREAGEIAGRAYEERRRVDSPERPLRDATITLLPQPEALTRRLEAIKDGARNSDRAFRAAVSGMLGAQREHERAVRAAGGTGLVFSVASGPEGTFTIPGVPAGAWILIAREETLVPRAGHQITKKDREMYRVGPALEAYRSVRLWVREVTVVGGRVETVELTDRNVWFSGVVEVRSGAGR